MEFEWDEEKRLANIAKHGIDFQRARFLFDGRSLYDQKSDRFGEERVTSTGLLDGEFITAVWTQRGVKRRLISVRRARHAEERAHRELHGGRA